MKRGISMTLTGLFLAGTLTSSEQPPSVHELRAERTRDQLVAAVIRTANRLTASQIIVDSDSPLLESVVCRNNDNSDGAGIVLEEHPANPYASKGVDQLVRRAVTVEGIEKTDQGYRMKPGAAPVVCYTKEFAVSNGRGGVSPNGTEMWIIEGRGNDLELRDRALGGAIDLNGGTQENLERIRNALDEFTLALHGLEQMAPGNR